MIDPRPTRDTMSIEEAAISNMWEIAAIVELRNILNMNGLLRSLIHARPRSPEKGAV